MEKHNLNFIELIKKFTQKKEMMKFKPDINNVIYETCEEGRHIDFKLYSEDELEKIMNLMNAKILEDRNLETKILNGKDSKYLTYEEFLPQLIKIVIAAMPILKR